MKLRRWGRKMTPRKPDARRQMLINTAIYGSSAAAFMMTVEAIATLR